MDALGKLLTSREKDATNTEQTQTYICTEGILFMQIRNSILNVDTCVIKHTKFRGRHVYIFRNLRFATWRIYIVGAGAGVSQQVGRRHYIYTHSSTHIHIHTLACICAHVEHTHIHTLVYVCM